VLSKAHKGYAERLPVALRSERGAPSGGLSSLFLCLSKTENDEEEVGGFLYYSESTPCRPNMKN
jgi:hypothetical protein